MTLARMFRSFALILFLVGIARAEAQALNPRWHGHWDAGNGQTLRIDEKGISTPSIQDCKWRSPPDPSLRQCLSFYSGTVTKAQLLDLQNGFARSLARLDPKRDLQERTRGQAHLRQNQALLDRLGNEKFRTVSVEPYVHEESYTGDVETYFILSENTIYAVVICEPCLGESFTLTAYNRAPAPAGNTASSNPSLTQPTPPTPSTPPAPSTPPVAQEPPRSTAPSAVAKADAPVYKPIEYTDFLIDHKAMTGQRIRIKASIQSVMNSAVLRRNELDMNFISAEIADLSREDRKRILTMCQHVTCAGVFYGQVEKPVLSPVIKVEKIEWQGTAGMLDRLRDNRSR